MGVRVSLKMLELVWKLSARSNLASPRSMECKMLRTAACRAGFRFRAPNTILLRSARAKQGREGPMRPSVSYPIPEKANRDLQELSS